MASIRSQMLGLESLACDFFPYMWNDLETYDTMPGLQNLHTSSLHGVSTLDIRISAPPKLCKLRLDGVYLLRSDAICGVTDLEVIVDWDT